MNKQTINLNAVNVINTVQSKMNKQSNKLEYFKKLGFIAKLSDTEKTRLKREIKTRNMKDKDYSELHYEQIPGYLAKYKSLYLLHFYYNGLDINEKHTLSVDGKNAYSALIRFFLSSALFDMFLKISSMSDLSHKNEYQELLRYSDIKNISKLNDLIRKINKKSHNILKDFLENKVEKNILSERIDKYFNNINSDDVLSVIKGLRNKIAHGGITASISLNDEKGNK